MQTFSRQRESFKGNFAYSHVSNSPGGGRGLCGVPGSSWWYPLSSCRASSVPTSSDRGHGTYAYCFFVGAGRGATRCLPRSAMRRLPCGWLHRRSAAAACRPLIDKARRLLPGNINLVRKLLEFVQWQIRSPVSVWQRFITRSTNIAEHIAFNAIGFVIYVFYFYLVWRDWSMTK